MNLPNEVEQKRQTLTFVYLSQSNGWKIMNGTPTYFLRAIDKSKFGIIGQLALALQRLYVSIINANADH